MACFLQQRKQNFVVQGPGSRLHISETPRTWLYTCAQIPVRTVAHAYAYAAVIIRFRCVRAMVFLASLKMGFRPSDPCQTHLPGRKISLESMFPRVHRSIFRINYLHFFRHVISIFDWVMIQWTNEKIISYSPYIGMYMEVVSSDLRLAMFCHGG